MMLNGISFLEFYDCAILAVPSHSHRRSRVSYSLQHLGLNHGTCAASYRHEFDQPSMSTKCAWRCPSTLF